MDYRDRGHLIVGGLSSMHFLSHPRARSILSQCNLENLAATGATILPEACGKTLTLEVLTDPHKGLFAQRAIVTFVLIGFYSYPFVTILYGKWPIRPSNLTQPQAGIADIGWCSLLTMFFYVVLIVPFWGWLWEVTLARHAMNPRGGSYCRYDSLNWVCAVGVMIIVLFMSLTLSMLPGPSHPPNLEGNVSSRQRHSGLVLAWLCVVLTPTWITWSRCAPLAGGSKGSAALLCITLQFAGHPHPFLAGITLDDLAR